jgi:hypothetical protein
MNHHMSSAANSSTIMAIARKPHVITDDEVEVNVVMGDVLIGLNG